MKFNLQLKKNQETLKERLSSSDVVFFEFKISNKNGLLIYDDPVTDKEGLGKLVVAPLSNYKKSPDIESICKHIFSPQAEVVYDVDTAVDSVVTGNCLLLIDGDDKAIKIDLLKYTSRGITEPPTSAVVKGPREGFTENLKTNIGLIRRRIKAESFTVEKITVGKYSKTDVSVMYLNDVADDNIVKTVIDRINKIDIDGAPDSSYIAKSIVEHKVALIKQVGNTEKPDILMAKILEGRVGILVDGSPIAITVPYLIIEDFQSSEDYFQNHYRANMQRVLRFISIVLALMLPSSFVAAQLFHLQIIPLNFLLTIVNSIKGIPLSPSFEMFFTLLIFEILNEASVRMPKYVGMALSVVGALVLGDTAVRAGIVSTPTIMIMALSGICLYTVPELVDSMSFLRLMYLIVAGSIGGYGMVLLTCFLFIYLVSLENFNVPVMAPFAPMKTADFKDTLLMTNLTSMKRRPLSIKPKNKVRMKNDES